MPRRKGRIQLVAAVPAEGVGVGVELGVGLGREEDDETKEEAEEEAEELVVDVVVVGEEAPPAWSRTLRMSSGLPMTIPMAPEMYPAQKSADMVPVG